MRKAFFLTSLPQLQKGAVVSALGFALFVGTSALAPVYIYERICYVLC